VISQALDTRGPLCRSSAFKYGDCNALGWRPVVKGEAQDYTYITYRELDEKVTHVGSAIKAVNVQKGMSVGVYAANSVEWMITMKAVDFCGAVIVPLYDTFGPEAVEYIIKHSETTIIFCASNKLAALTEVLPKVKAQIIQVVVWSSSPGVPIHEQLIAVRHHAWC
jgi:long-chain acyl-CoA synthetase